jgi:hypothetical protein
MFLIAGNAFGPVFLLGSLALLLAVSRPATRREWFWIAVCSAALLAWFRLPNSLAQQTARAAGVFFIGAFVTLTLAGMRSLFSRAALAVVIATVAITAWFAILHLRFSDVQNEIVTQTWAGWRVLFPGLPVLPPHATGDVLAQGDITDRTRQLALATTASATLFPGVLALTALLGSWLSWLWYHRIARAPIAPPAPPLRDFRFNDQLVWLLVLAIGLTLIHLSPSLDVVTQNVLLVVLALYWLRGLAVMRTAVRRASPLFIGVIVLIMLPMFPFVLVGFTLLGVADTWVDFRRRMAPPSGVPT